MKCGGCAAKLPPKFLREATKNLPLEEDPRLLVGVETFDDAGVFQLDKETALVQTVDFFTPIVDDPYLFGQIAAANALSDVYAMGGTPLTCMNIISFPKDQSPEIMHAILRGGSDKAREAKAVVVGGHSISDDQLSYGMAVTGVVHPQRVLTNAGAKPGDLLILTKPLGTGVLTTARRGDRIDDTVLQPAVDSMLQLHVAAVPILHKFGVDAVTDVTGFSFLGHAKQMAEASGVSFIIDPNKVPLFPEVVRLIQEGVTTKAVNNNREYVAPFLSIEGNVSQNRLGALLDPQSSGGFLIAASEKCAEQLVIELHEVGFRYTTIIGKVVSSTNHLLLLRN